MNSKNLFLGGGGDIDQSTAIDSVFFDAIPNNSKILYIPIAMDENDISYDMCSDWFTKLISTHSVSKFIDYEMWRESDPLPILSEFAAVYIGGGNTYYLLEVLTKTGLSHQLINFLKQGKPVFGGSAGAIIFGKTIETVIEENTINSSIYLGLNLLGGLSVRCHYNKDAANLMNISIRTDSPVIALAETSGVVFGDGGFRVLGDAVILFNGDKDYQVINSEFDYGK